MTSDLCRRPWLLLLAALLIWGFADLTGSVGQAAENAPGAAADPETQALTDQLDAMIGRAAETLRGRQGEGEPIEPDADAATLRERLEEAETQIRLLKNVVIQALRAQSAAEEALRSEQAARPGAGAPESPPAQAGVEDPVLAQQVEALSDSVRQLRADVDALRGAAPSDRPLPPEDQAALRPSDPMQAPETAADPLEEDAMLPEAGIGGRFEPWVDEGEPQPSGDLYAAVPADAARAAAGDGLRIAEVHFNSGSAELTPGAERRTLQAVERIRSMAPAKVRVVAFADRVGDAAHNLVLSKERALAVAAVLENAGFNREVVEVVGSGEDGIPVPTPDGVPEPLNRSAGIFVVRDATG